jgi:hypothetical protein
VKQVAQVDSGFHVARAVKADENVTVLLRENNGEAGIRTLGTLLGYNALAKRRFRPLSHLTKYGGGKAIAMKPRASNESSRSAFGVRRRSQDIGNTVTV